jgi:hypothetical protein
MWHTRFLLLANSRQIFEKSELPNFIKICPVGAELFHADRHTETDMRKQILAFRERALKFYLPPTLCIYVLRMDLRTNSDYVLYTHITLTDLVYERRIVFTVQYGLNI